MVKTPFSIQIEPDWEALLRCIRRQGTPERVHYFELYLDQEIQDELCRRYDILEGLNADEAFFSLKRHLTLQRFLGYDYVSCGLDDFDMPFTWNTVQDQSELARSGGRRFIDEHIGPISNWDDFEKYPWPNPLAASTRSLEWYTKHLPEDMCIVVGQGLTAFTEYLSYLMGYETLCYALYDQQDLVKAISDRLISIAEIAVKRMLEFERVKIVWGDDDMGFKTGTLISPQDLRSLTLPGHQLMADICHAAKRVYILHSCGKLSEIMDDLIERVKIDGKHSFEDTIEPVIDAKAKYGDRIALLGGIDMDFMCRANTEQIRLRVQKTLQKCLPGGGYCLGTGNSVANYIPVENYISMLDEGRKYSPAKADAIVK